MIPRKFRFARALLPEGMRDNVLVTLGGDGMIQAAEANAPGRDGQIVRGIALPGMANVHSHAHQRAMAGLAEVAGPGADSFWTWREVMYRFAGRFTPDDLQAVAAQLYIEALKAGFTSIGEFQYLHHQPDGSAYANPAEMSLRCLAAAGEAGIAVTLLPALYAHGGFGGEPPGPGQRRFVCEADLFARIFETLAAAIQAVPTARLGLAPHSLRAVTPQLLQRVLAMTDDIVPQAPVHLHIAEQEKEVADCLAFCGERPVATLLASLPVSARWCLIHATHMTDAETDALAATGAVAGLCPTTEANLGDGTFNAARWLAQAGHIAIGSDSHISVSVAEDLRQLEYSQRLRHHARNVLGDGPGRSTGARLFTAAAQGGGRAIAQPAGTIAAGSRADFVVLDPDHPALIGRSGAAILDSWIFSGGNSCVRDVYVAGAPVIVDRHHAGEEQVLARYRQTMRRLQEGS